MCLFFFNFGHIDSFGLNRPFRRFRPISADMAWVGPIQRESARVGAASARFGTSRLKNGTRHVAWRGRTRLDAWAAASLARRRVPPRPCFIAPKCMPTQSSSGSSSGGSDGSSSSSRNTTSSGLQNFVCYNLVYTLNVLFEICYSVATNWTWIHLIFRVLQKGMQ